MHKVVQVAVFFNHLRARAQHQMKGIAENHLRTDGLDIPRQHTLHRAVGTHRHKGRRLHFAARKTKTAAPGLALGVLDLKLHKALATHGNSSPGA